MDVAEEGAGEPENTQPILHVQDLRVHYRTGPRPAQEVCAVHGATFDLWPGEALGLIGESGCGKTTLALSLMRLLPQSGRVVSGDIRLGGQSLIGLGDREINRIRWKKISMVFQGVMNAMTPGMPVIEQVAEPIVAHEGVSKQQALTRSGDLLDRVGIATRHHRAYPHEFSGGMLQRALIAMALACQPAVIIADEPGTALDVVVQTQILDLLTTLQRELHLATLVISHDLSVITSLTSTCAVMYAGHIVEFGPTHEVMGTPRHPYTEALLRSYPRLHSATYDLQAIPGSPPDLADPPTGCPFHPRCRYAMDECRREMPSARHVSADHYARCVLVPDVGSEERDARRWKQPTA